MTAVVRIDPNVRVKGNRTFSGFEDIVDGVPLRAEEEVLAWEEESNVMWPAVVYDLDFGKKLVYLTVAWSMGYDA